MHSYRKKLNYVMKKSRKCCIFLKYMIEIQLISDSVIKMQIQ